MYDELERVELPLVVAKGSSAGEVHTRSALNWGQRPGRNPNQSYIPVPMVIAKSEFFPEPPTPFTALTDDGEVLILRRAQQGGKAIQSADNGQIGRYFRRRLGLTDGEAITTAHLELFGTKSVFFFRARDDKFLMLFRPNL